MSIPDHLRQAWVSHPLREARTGERPIGSYGGHPRGVRTHEWPHCRVCGNPMCHMLQMDAGPYLDLGGYQRMSVFICHATGGRCEDWDPWKGANRVVLHRVADDELFDGPPTVRVYRRMKLALAEPIDEMSLMLHVKEGGMKMDDALARLRVDKLGGGAVWLFGDSTPKSPTGLGPMRLALQVTTDLVAFDITPRGVAYVFVDPHDTSPDRAVLLWQGA